VTGLTEINAHLGKALEWLPVTLGHIDSWLWH